MSEDPPPFEQLDYLYIPSTDVTRDAAYFSEVLGREGDVRYRGWESEETFEIPQ